MNKPQFRTISARFAISPLLLLLAAGCAHTPAPVVQEVQNELQSLEKNRDVAKHASVELYEAKEAITRLERADARDQDLKQPTYVARQSMEIARVTGEASALESEFKQLGEKTTEARLRSRELDAQKAESKAEQAMSQAEKAKSQAEQAQSLAEQRKLEAEAALEKASNAMSRAKELEAKISNLEARETERGVILTMRNVLFGFDQSQLESGAKQALGDVASYLNEFPDRSIVVEGHSDNVGDDGYNKRLSRDRAQSVADFLRTRGVERSRVSVEGFGEDAPIAPNDTNNGRSKNRRVEIVLEG